MSATKCTATAYLYSGRPDPTWEISPRTRQQLEHTWNALPPSTRAPPSPPGLGYRGCAVDWPPGNRWFVFDAVAMLTARTSTPEYRQDAARKFERAILASAPDGLLPKGSLPSAVEP
jgi:hypothetical protein